MAQLNFNASQVEPQIAFEPVQPGWYNVIIDESEIKPTNAGDGSYLAFRFNILDGDYANQKLFCRLNIENKSEKTVEIAYQQLSAICHATNTIQVNDSTELHGKPFMVKVTLKPPSTDPQTGKTYDASNEFKGFKACEDSTEQSNVSNDPSWTQSTNQQQQQPEQQESTEQKPDTIQQSWNQSQGDQSQGDQSQGDQQQTTVEKTPVQNNPQKEKPPWMQGK